MGKKYLHLVADIYVYKVAIQIKWADPLRWQHLLVHPAGMHTLMAFLGCIGNLMKGSGLEEILNVAYKGVNNMLNGKSWPKALRGLWMVVTAVLKDYIKAGKDSYSEISSELESARYSTIG